VGSDILLGHYGHGIVITSNVVIGRRVKIWQNVTVTGRRGAQRGGQSSPGSQTKIIIEDGVSIGANAVVIAPRGCTLRIGRGARIGAGTVVTHDIPARATVVAPAARVLLAETTAKETTAEVMTAADSSEELPEAERSL
jgi:serine acetyltransferase